MVEQPQEIEQDEDGDEPMSPEEQDAYETMVSALRNHIFGQANDSIVEKLRGSQDLERDVGNMMLALVMEAAKQAAAAGVDADFELLVSVGTEVIDDLYEIAEAMGLVDEVTDDMREKALFAAIQGYLSTAEVPPEEAAMAQEQLAAMNENGEVERVAQDIRQKAIRDEGVDPFAGGAQGPQAPQRPAMMGA